MEKFIPLQKANICKMHHRNKDLRDGPGNNQLIRQPVVAGQPAGNSIDIMQLYYTALIQCHSTNIRKNKDNDYLHCT